MVQPGSAVPGTTCFEKEKECSNYGNSHAEISSAYSGSVKDKLKKFEGMNRQGNPQPLGRRTLLNQKDQEIRPRILALASENKVGDSVRDQVRELESVLRHREELIRSLEGTVAQKESELSFVLKEKFELSKVVVASRSASLSCAPSYIGAQRVSSAETSAESFDDSAESPGGCTAVDPNAKPSSFSLQLTDLGDAHVEEGLSKEHFGTCGLAEGRQGGHSTSTEGRSCETPDGSETKDLEPHDKDGQSSCRKIHDLKVLHWQENEDPVHAGGCRLRPALHTESRSDDLENAAVSEEVDDKFLTPSHSKQIISQAEHANPIKPDPHSATSTCTPTAQSRSESPSAARSKPLLADALKYLSSNRWRLDSKSKRPAGAGKPTCVTRSEDSLVRELAVQNDDFPTAKGSSALWPDIEDTVANAEEDVDGGMEASDPASMHSGTRFQAELFFKALMVQTQARIDAEAETSDVLAMHDELSSKIDALQNAFEEICQELDAVRKENRALNRWVGTQEENLCREQGISAVTAALQNGKLQCRSPEQLNDCTMEQLKAAINSLEQKLHEAQMDRQRLEESKCKTDAALAATQEELKETKMQLTSLEKQCKLLQDIDKRTWRALEMLILAKDTGDGISDNNI
ncbi:myosin-3 [Cyclospora cayetanensis]|uniref:Myosin-3 n=1 Tax=Cyclospora cayetanensis TaxID=88456 RepID=A0A6P6RZN5_9EIME|nr:myosin-3 [Cyclospora cayetanensis]